ncbi:hypothetical protein CXX78_01905 [Candidatus Parvarchaeota archaeon]|nr:MAG: hypothetical protein CXX78_01905 [Candidatus Parvarchaeota archaeon]
MKLTIRKTKKGDIEKYVIPIEKFNMKNYDSSIAIEEIKNDFLEDSKKGSVFFLEIEGKTIGFFSFTNNEKKSSLHINNMQIDKDYQGKGFGKEILDLIEIEAKKLKCSKITLSVFKTNRAIKLYTKFGFKENTNKSDDKVARMEKEIEL